MTQATFAKLLGTAPITVSRYLSGQRRPSWAVLEKIVAVTEGKVTPTDFLQSGRRVS